MMPGAWPGMQGAPAPAEEDLNSKAVTTASSGKISRVPRPSSSNCMHSVPAACADSSARPRLCGCGATPPM